MSTAGVGGRWRVNAAWPRRLNSGAVGEDFQGVDLGVVLVGAEEGDAEVPAGCGDVHGLDQGFAGAAGFLEDVDVLEPGCVGRVDAVDAHGEDALAGGCDAFVGFGEVQADGVAGVGQGDGDALDEIVLGAVEVGGFGVGDGDG